MAVGEGCEESEKEGVREARPLGETLYVTDTVVEVLSVAQPEAEGEAEGQPELVTERELVGEAVAQALGYAYVPAERVLG